MNRRLLLLLVIVLVVMLSGCPNLFDNSNGSNGSGANEGSETEDDGGAEDDGETGDGDEPEIVRYSVSTSVTGAGGILLEPTESSYEEGSQVTAEAIALLRWSFDSWGGDLSGSDNPAQLTVDSDKSISATFTEYDWQGAQIIDAATGNDARVPVVGMDWDGNAIALFQQITSGNERVYAVTRSEGAWGSATIIDANTGDHAVNPAIAVSSGGSAAAVMHDASSIYAANYNGSSWGAAIEIDAGAETTGNQPAVAIDSSGSAVAVFQQSDGSNDRVYASMYNGTSWGASTIVDAGAGNNASEVSVAMGPEGEAFVLFSQAQSGTGRVYANRYNGSSWDGAEIIDGGALAGATAADIAFNGDGAAVAVFQKSVSETSRIYANGYSSGSWGTATAIDPGAGIDNSDSLVAIDGGGNAFAVFLRVFDSEVGEVSAYAAVNVDGGWSTAKEISFPLDATYGEVRNVVIAADGHGGAIATFEQMTGSDVRLYTTFYQNGEWSTPEIVDGGNSGAREPDLAAGPRGEVAVVFQQGFPTWRVNANVLE